MQLNLATLTKMKILAVVMVGQATKTLMGMVALMPTVELAQTVAILDPTVILDHPATLGQAQTRAMEMALETLLGVAVVEHLEPLVMKTQVVTLVAVGTLAHLATLAILDLHLPMVDQENRIRKQVRRQRSMVRQVENL